MWVAGHPERIRKRPREPDEKRPRGLKSPQGLTYVNFHCRLAEGASDFLLTLSRRWGFSRSRTLSRILYEYEIILEKSGTT